MPMVGLLFGVAHGDESQGLRQFLAAAKGNGKVDRRVQVDASVNLAGCGLFSLFARVIICSGDAMCPVIAGDDKGKIYYDRKDGEFDHDNDTEVNFDAVFACFDSIGLTINAGPSLIESATEIMGELGGREFFPGVYKNTQSLSICNPDGNIVTLNAGEDPCAQFIFLTDGQLTVCNTTEMQLLGGAKASNVFWFVYGNVDIQENSTLVGNVIGSESFDQEITIRENAVVDGRVIADGTVSCDACTIGPSSVTTTTGTIDLAGCGSIVLFAQSANCTSSGSCLVIQGDGEGKIGLGSGTAVNFEEEAIATGEKWFACAQYAGPNINYAYDLDAMPLSDEMEGQLGGQDFTPGVYEGRSNQDFSICGKVTLDAKGDSCAQFIFRVQGGITVCNSSEILLVGGAKASNVFWFAEDTVIIQENSTLIGNLVAFASVTIERNGVVDGRVFTQGFLSCDACTIGPAIDSPSTSPSASPSSSPTQAVGHSVSSKSPKSDKSGTKSSKSSKSEPVAL
eukprot:CAMPEP_0198138050 /NCGR_PEP_ID=MMETSP1443-20131203/1490_1 /TAXON_ID=186043 /ORGANISM="Entomoneis sp., Strain CCMP2396" /LENGTH=509 /DNA_ID=CAMNT_0043799681 /DNA_START=125 /DNA_END=1654 /DNA_ORIENTATION=+